MPGEKCLICNWCGNLFSIALTKDEEYSINCRNNIVAVIDRWSGRQFKKKNWKPNILSYIILKKKCSGMSKLFPLCCIFLYISKWSKVLEFYLMHFFNMKSRSVKFRHFLDNFPVHYAALFKNRTINNNHMALLMALHHTHDKLWYFFQMLQEQHSWHASNVKSVNNRPSFISYLRFS